MSPESATVPTAPTPWVRTTGGFGTIVFLASDVMLFAPFRGVLRAPRDNGSVATAEWTEVQRDLHRAIEHLEVELDLQPIVDLTSGAVAYETLARWNHPTGAGSHRRRSSRWQRSPD